MCSCMPKVLDQAYDIRVTQVLFWCTFMFQGIGGQGESIIDSSTSLINIKKKALSWHYFTPMQTGLFLKRALQTKNRVLDFPLAMKCNDPAQTVHYLNVETKDGYSGKCTHQSQEDSLFILVSRGLSQSAEEKCPDSVWIFREIQGQKSTLHLFSPSVQGWPPV